MEAEKYPEFLTMNESDKFEGFENFECDTYKEEYNKAVEFAKKNGGFVYTRIDEENEIYYWKGFHYVNRTGYVVLK